MKASIDELANEVCRDIPEGFYIEIHLEKSSGYATLYRFPATELDELCPDFNLEEQVRQALAMSQGKEYDPSLKEPQQ